MPEKKRRQHYVWRHYVEAWATAGKLWCLRRGGQPFQVSARMDTQKAHEQALAAHRQPLDDEIQGF